MAIFGAASAPAAPSDAPSAALAGDGKSVCREDPGDGCKFKLVAIPAGTFNMGSPDSEKGHKKDEAPQIEVQVDAFI